MQSFEPENKVASCALSSTVCCCTAGHQSGLDMEVADLWCEFVRERQFSANVQVVDHTYSEST